MNNNIEFFSKYFERIADKISKVDEILLIKTLEFIEYVSKNNGKIVIAGNGGSAAIASHVAVDFTKAAGVRAMTFNEADLITCFSNDFGYEHWIEKAIEYFCDSKDLVILISSSGMSKNIINASIRAKELGIRLITFSGFKEDNDLRSLGDLNFWADSCEYNIVESAHQIWLLAIIDKIIENKKVIH